MRRRRADRVALAAMASLACGGCSETPSDTSARLGTFPVEETSKVASEPEGDSARKPLGLMTSLPLYWPLGTDFGALARAEVEVPWQRRVLEREHHLTLLDTLTPIPGLTPDAPETDPLAGLDRIAIVQPRGLSPADNAALDQWVRQGGSLLLVLDPALTGEYELGLGDPRRPTDTALIPPVVARWGLEMLFDAEQPMLREQSLSGEDIPVSLGGELRAMKGDNDCRIFAEGLAARCTVGKGRITLLADAFAFEVPDDALATGDSAISAILDFAFDGRAFNHR